MKNFEKNISFLMGKFNITREQAIELINFDSGAAKPSEKPKPLENNIQPQKKKGGITEEELVSIEKILTAGFSDGKSFKNKDVSSVIGEELGLSAQSVPSRLKRLVERGFLEDLGGSPKTYKIK